MHTIVILGGLHYREMPLGSSAPPEPAPPRVRATVNTSCRITPQRQQQHRLYAQDQIKFDQNRIFLAGIRRDRADNRIDGQDNLITPPRWPDTRPTMAGRPT